MFHLSELQKLLFQSLNWNKARISCLAQILQALICVRTVNLTQISAFFKNSTKQESSYRRVRRFFSGFSFDRTVIIPMVLSLFDLKKDLLLILDRTNWRWGEKEINILLISVAYRGIGIPIFWQVSSKGGSSSTATRKQVLKAVLQKIGAKRIRAFLADREFVGEDWFRFLARQKIPFIIRIKKNTLAGGIQNGTQVPVIELWNNRKKPLFNYRVLIWGHFLYLSISQAEGAKEPIIVVSNHEFSDAIPLYLRRWEIETLFGCLKTRGFRLEDTHMTAPERIEKLLFVLAIAFVWSYKLGEVESVKNPIPVKTHGRPSKSLFRLGLDCLRSILASIGEKIEEFMRAIRLLRIFKLGC
jgi:hypothetical protein